MRLWIACLASSKPCRMASTAAGRALRPCSHRPGCCGWFTVEHRTAVLRLVALAALSVASLSSQATFGCFSPRSGSRAARRSGSRLVASLPAGRRGPAGIQLPKTAAARRPQAPTWRPEEWISRFIVPRQQAYGADRATTPSDGRIIGGTANEAAAANGIRRGHHGTVTRETKPPTRPIRSATSWVWRSTAVTWSGSRGRVRDCRPGQPEQDQSPYPPRALAAFRRTEGSGRWLIPEIGGDAANTLTQCPPGANRRTFERRAAVMFDLHPTRAGLTEPEKLKRSWRGPSSTTFMERPGRYCDDQ